MKAAVVIDAWKREIFERHLKQSGYTWEGPHPWPGDALILKVETNNVQALGEVVKAANTEAALTKGAK